MVVTIRVIVPEHDPEPFDKAFLTLRVADLADMSVLIVHYSKLLHYFLRISTYYFFKGPPDSVISYRGSRRHEKRWPGRCLSTSR